MSDLVETWKPVLGYEGLYEVSDAGKIRGLRFINGQVDIPLKEPRLINGRLSSGYRCVDLCKNDKKKARLVHRIVLEAFTGPCPEGHNGAHLDGDASNNRLSNLRWVTISENQLHKIAHGTMPMGESCYNSVFRDKDIHFIRAAKGYIKQRDIANMFGVARSTIQRIQAGTSWRHIG